LEFTLEKRLRRLWLVNPETRALEVLRLQGDEWLIASVHSDADRVRAEPFDAIELDLPASGAKRPPSHMRTPRSTARTSRFLSCRG